MNIVVGTATEFIWSNMDVVVFAVSQYLGFPYGDIVSNGYTVTKKEIEAVTRASYDYYPSVTPTNPAEYQAGPIYPVH